MATQAVEPIELPAATRATLAKMATELRLTPKQFAFASLIVSGCSQAEAYRRAYDVDPNTSNLYPNASLLAKHEKVSATVEAARATLNHLRAERGREWREKIDEVLWEVASDPAAKPGDRVQAVKTAGTLRHVQAFAAVSADAEAKALTDLSEAISCFTNELETAGIRTINATYEVVCSESQQNLKSVRYLPLVDEDDLADCIPGAD